MQLLAEGRISSQLTSAQNESQIAQVHYIFRNDTNSIKINTDIVHSEHFFPIFLSTQKKC